MSDIFFKEMQIPRPKYNLSVKEKTHGSMTGQMIKRIEKVLLNEKPDLVIVYGDTNSTLSGAIAASKLKIKIAHIEAGLRSFNLEMPEEINRILTDRISSFLFCPTKTAVENLNNEGISKWKTSANVYNSGDVMLDGFKFFKNFAKKPNNLKIKNDFALCTIHRSENINNFDRMREILSALNQIAKSQQIILPIHPHTKKILKKKKFDISNLTLINPIGFLNMLWLLDHCSLVFTDSGGLQKEAYFFSKKCLILRDETEWSELVEIGSNVLVGANKINILETYNTNIKSNIENLNLNLFGFRKCSKLYCA
jgi:UDP-GlcNAc3NAcA epimerase